MATHKLPVACPEVIFKPLSEGAVLFHSKDEVYFGLSPVATQIWSLLQSCATAEEVCRELQRQYPEVNLEVLRADFTELLEALLSHGLLVGSADSGSRSDATIEEAREA